MISWIRGFIWKERKESAELKELLGLKPVRLSIKWEPEPHLMSTSMPSGQYSLTTMPNNNNSNNSSSKEHPANTTRTVVNSSFRK